MRGIKTKVKHCVTRKEQILDCLTRPHIYVVSASAKLYWMVQIGQFRCRMTWSCILYRHFSPIKGNISKKLKRDFRILLSGMSFDLKLAVDMLSEFQFHLPYNMLLSFISVLLRKPRNDIMIIPEMIQNAGNCASIVSQRIRIRIWSMTSNILNLLGLQNLNYISSLSAALFEVWLVVRGVQTAYEGERDVPRIDPLYCIRACGNLSSALQIDRTFKLCLTAHQRPITLRWNWSRL